VPVDLGERDLHPAVEGLVDRMIDPSRGLLAVLERAYGSLGTEHRRGLALINGKAEARVHSVAGHHGARDLGRLIQVVARSGGDVVKLVAFGPATTESD